MVIEKYSNDDDNSINGDEKTIMMIIIIKHYKENNNYFVVVLRCTTRQPLYIPSKNGRAWGAWWGWGGAGGGGWGAKSGRAGDGTAGVSAAARKRSYEAADRQGDSRQVGRARSHKQTQSRPPATISPRACLSRRPTREYRYY